MAFFQDPPELAPGFDDDRVLVARLRRSLPEDVFRAALPELRSMGELASGPLYSRLLAEGSTTPTLTSWSPWGRRIDRIELTPLWKEAARLAAERGLVAIAYDRPFAEHSRLVQFALVHLFDPSTAVYSCPLAMTDGAAKTLLASGNSDLVARAVPRLTSRDPERAWTSGQWMTERTGGSDVGLSETRAVPDGDAWRLFGTKWFTSATTSEMALTLARPDGGRTGGAGLALFYVETRDGDGHPNGLRIHRLKDKLGTRMVPTAELELDGARALAVAGTSDGVRNITPMLGITRTWNAVCAVAGMRRAVALARAYAKKRVAFGAPLSEKVLHQEVVATLQAEYEGAFALTWRVVELLGREETGRASAEDVELLRLLTPLAKLATGKQAVAVASEALESFGGAGYVEDTGLPRLLRDAQVLPIWEGTTNVLALDVLRALARGADAEVLAREVRRARDTAPSGSDLRALGDEAVRRAESALATFARLAGTPSFVEVNARKFALAIARALSLALMVESAAVDSADGRAVHAARKFAARPVDTVDPAPDLAATAALANDVP
ncbi:MAG: acyl-CoA dehydrogenase family protein [Polyangiaceae bacterium]